MFSLGDRGLIKHHLIIKSQTGDTLTAYIFVFTSISLQFPNCMTFYHVYQANNIYKEFVVIHLLKYSIS